MTAVARIHSRAVLVVGSQSGLPRTMRSGSGVLCISAAQLVVGLCLLGGAVAIAFAANGTPIGLLWSDQKLRLLYIFITYRYQIYAT